MIIDHSYDHTPKLSSASIILWIKHELKYEIWIKYGFWSKSQNLINYLYFSEGHKPNRQQYCTIFMIVQRSCYCRTLAKILKGVEEKRGVCGKCGGLTFPPHQHIPSNQFPELPVTIPFFLEKAMARIEPLLMQSAKQFLGLSKPNFSRSKFVQTLANSLPCWCVDVKMQNAERNSTDDWAPYEVL